MVRFRDSNDQHHLIVSSDDVPIEALRLWIDRTTAMVILLLRLLGVLVLRNFLALVSFLP